MCFYALISLYIFCAACFFKYLKKEETDRRSYQSLDQLKHSLFSYINGFTIVSDRILIIAACLPFRQKIYFSPDFYLSTLLTIFPLDNENAFFYNEKNEMEVMQMNRTWYRSGEALLQEIEQTVVGEQEIAFWYLGQCGFVYKGAVTVYIDVMLNDHFDASGNSKRFYPAPFSPEQVQADYVICTHNHADHLAVETVNGIAKGDSHTRFIIPASCCSVLTDIGIPTERIIPMHAKQTLYLPNLSISAVSTAHPVHQKDQNGYDFSLGFQLDMNGIQLLHLGDTYLTQQLIRDLLTLPTPHIFFPPINGQDYFRTARNCIGNLNFNEAAQLAGILHADLTVPTHFDMFFGNTADPLEFARTFMQYNSSAKWHILSLGERFIYRR